MNPRTRYLLCRTLFTAVLLFVLPALASAVAPGDSCLGCHASQTKMAQLGFPHFTVTPAQVSEQSGMSAGCADCHLGNRTENDRDLAHQGMGRLQLVRKKGLLVETAQRRAPLRLGDNPMTRIQHQVFTSGKIKVDPTVGLLLYQDKRRDNLSQDFSVMEKTCGSCHSEQFRQFTTSTMARNAKQSRYRSWADGERGPHNCGVWFDGNYDKIAADTAVPFSKGQSALNQRSCNTCHVGCLDCHFDPRRPDPSDRKLGMHTFNRTPKPESCYGGGRGQICHAGPEERRRGAGYFGASYANPEGMEPDLHRAKQVGCLDCHESTKSSKKMGHAMVKRQGKCDSCHPRAIEKHRRSLHKNLSCEACHIKNVSGYQATFWGPGKLAGAETPFYKYKDYYGVMKEPILIRDQRGRWIAVKPFPMAVVNQKKSALKPGLHWRWPKGLPDLQRTDDAWGYVGLFDGLPENNRALLWVQMDKVSHKYGKSRSCASCHELPGGEQVQQVSWDFSDAGALPFSGSHTVVAGSRGMFIRDIKSEKIELSEGYRLSGLAPWFYLKEKWIVPGDFSLPPLKNRKLYDRVKGGGAARPAGIIHVD